MDFVFCEKQIHQTIQILVKEMLIFKYVSISVLLFVNFLYHLIVMKFPRTIFHIFTPFLYFGANRVYTSLALAVVKLSRFDFYKFFVSATEPVL